MRKVACVRVYLVLQQKCPSVAMLHPVHKPHDVEEGDELQPREARGHTGVQAAMVTRHAWQLQGVFCACLLAHVIQRAHTWRAPQKNMAKYAAPEILGQAVPKM